jgi:ClpX C4-type zinc finger
MFATRKLSCSFCGKSAAEVAKLAAGPKVFICDVCAAYAHRIMSDPSVRTPPPPFSRSSEHLEPHRAWLFGRRNSRRSGQVSPRLAATTASRPAARLGR